MKLALLGSLAAVAGTVVLATEEPVADFDETEIIPE